MALVLKQTPNSFYRALEWVGDLFIVPKGRACMCFFMFFYYCTVCFFVRKIKIKNASGHGEGGILAGGGLVAWIPANWDQIQFHYFVKYRTVSFFFYFKLFLGEGDEDRDEEANIPTFSYYGLKISKTGSTRQF